MLRETRLVSAGFDFIYKRDICIIKKNWLAHNITSCYLLLTFAFSKSICGPGSGESGTRSWVWKLVCPALPNRLPDTQRISFLDQQRDDMWSEF